MPLLLLEVGREVRYVSGYMGGFERSRGLNVLLQKGGSCVGMLEIYCSVHRVGWLVVA